MGAQTAAISCMFVDDHVATCSNYNRSQAPGMACSEPTAITENLLFKMNVLVLAGRVAVRCCSRIREDMSQAVTEPMAGYVTTGS